MTDTAWQVGVCLTPVAKQGLECCRASLQYYCILLLQQCITLIQNGFIHPSHFLLWAILLSTIEENITGTTSSICSIWLDCCRASLQYYCKTLAAVVHHSLVHMASCILLTFSLGSYFGLQFKEYYRCHFKYLQNYKCTELQKHQSYDSDQMLNVLFYSTT